MEGRSRTPYFTSLPVKLHLGLPRYSTLHCIICAVEVPNKLLMNPRREEIDGAQGVVASLMDIMAIVFIIIIIVVVIVYYFKCKRNPCQHGLVKSKYTISNLGSYLDHISPLVFLHHPVDAIYFDVSSSIDLVPHTCLLLKLSARWLSDSYVGCVVGVTGRYSRYVLEPREVLSCISQGTVLGACGI